MQSTALRNARDLYIGESKQRLKVLYVELWSNSHINCFLLPMSERVVT